MSSAPLGLYRAILTTHRRVLPATHRALGDTYVKAEWRLHKQAKPQQASQFLTEWTRYLVELETQPVLGAELKPEQVRALSPEQQEKLSQLRTAAENPE